MVQLRWSRSSGFEHRVICANSSKINNEPVRALATVYCCLVAQLGIRLSGVNAHETLDLTNEHNRATLAVTPTSYTFFAGQFKKNYGQNCDSLAPKNDLVEGTGALTLVATV